MILGGSSYALSSSADRRFLKKLVAPIDYLEADGLLLPVKEVRELIRQANQKSFADLKLLVILNADQLSEIAQNSLLKLIEEPGKSLALILIFNNFEALLPTVRSRLQLLRNEAVSLSEVPRAVLDDKNKLANLKDRSELEQLLVGELSFQKNNLLTQAQSSAAERVILLDRAWLRLKANANWRLTADWLLLHWFKE